MRSTTAIGRLGERIVWSYDLMVLRVYKDRILQCRADVSDYSVVSHSEDIPMDEQTVPKYWQYDEGNKVSDPTAQIDPTYAIPQKDPVTGEEHWRDDGY